MSIGPRISDGQVTSLALCWRVERRDGAGCALTSASEAVEHDGVRYEAAPGMMPAAIVRKGGIEAGSGEVAGAVTSAALSAGDLAAGRWDGAAVSLVAVDWDDVAQPMIAMAAGEIGEVSVAGDEFSAELRGAAAKLAAPVCPATSPTCRASFGDARCRVDLAGRTVRAVVVASAGDAITIDGVAEARFLFGRLRWLSGANSGLSAAIWACDGASLRVRELASGAVRVGDRVELREGCDKRLATCAGRFANIANFRGEPHVPGNDLLTRGA